MINRYLTDQVTLESLLTRDEYEGATYAPPQSIPARLHTRTQILRGDTGREITSNAHVSTTTLLKPGDRITDTYGTKREIVNVQINKHVDGRFSHYVGYLA